jgi:uncharacterized protein YdaU (DUF1376 family)
MAYEKAPAFQFYPKDWLSDARVRDLTRAERGDYIELLSYCWIEGSLPADPKVLARRLGRDTNRSVASLQRLTQMFAQVGDRLYHKRLEKERGKQNFFSELQRKRGKASARKRFSRTGSSGLNPVEPKTNPAGLSLQAGERVAWGNAPPPPPPLQDDLRALPGESLASYFARVKSQGEPS